MPSIILSVILLFFFGLVEVAGLFGYLNLVFCYPILIRLFTKKYFIFHLTVAGLLLDLFSIFPFGFYIIVFLLTGIIIHWWINHLSQISVTTILFTAFISALVYKLMIFIISLFFYHLKISQHLVCFDKAYFLDIIYFVIINTIFIVLAFSIIQMVKNKIRNKK